MYYVYVLKSLKNNRFYTGSTSDISRRLNEHNSGKNKSTKYTYPFELVYQERYDSRSAAYRREMYLKTGNGRRELKQLMGS
jgi:putative endonuclease